MCFSCAKQTREGTLLKTSLFFIPTKTSILNINIYNQSRFSGAKIYVFFTSYVIIFNLTCT